MGLRASSSAVPHNGEDSPEQPQAAEDESADDSSEQKRLFADESNCDENAGRILKMTGKDLPGGFWATLGLMGLSTTLIFALFRSRRWI